MSNEWGKIKDPYYVELYVDINLNIETFYLDDEEKERLAKHLEKYWRKQHKDDLIREARNELFRMKIDEILKDDD